MNRQNRENRNALDKINRVIPRLCVDGSRLSS